MNISDLPLKAPKLYEEFIDKIRNFYKKRGYTEVFTPYVQDEPNLEKYIQALELDITECSTKKHVYLHTSPERSMKTLLKEYRQNIFQITKVFRNDECGSLNAIEFTMLECYNLQNLDIIKEISALIKDLFGDSINGVSTDPKLASFEKVFEKYIGVVFSEDEDILKNNLISYGYEFDDNASWEELVNRMLVEIEPSLGKDAMEFLIDFPCKLGVLAKCKGNLSERFELFIDGIEVANGWIEEPSKERLKDIIQKASEYKSIKDKEKLLQDYHNDFNYAGYSIGIERLFYFYYTSANKI